MCGDFGLGTWSNNRCIDFIVPRTTLTKLLCSYALVFDITDFFIRFRPSGSHRNEHSLAVQNNLIALAMVNVNGMIDSYRLSRVASRYRTKEDQHVDEAMNRVPISAVTRVVDTLGHQTGNQVRNFPTPCFQTRPAVDV